MTQTRLIKGVFFLLLLLLVSPLFAVEEINIPLHIRIGEIRRASQPEIFANQILFTYHALHPVRHVGIAFQHEDFLKIHTFMVNDLGVFVYPYSIPKKETQLVYRLVVDGLWMEDPINPIKKTDLYGQKFSVVYLPRRDDSADPAPRREAKDSIQFVYYGPPNRRVNLVGSFNNWDPFMHPLEEISPGKYRLDLRLPPGEYRYFFVSDGIRITDSLNPRKAYLKSGQEVSFLTVEN